MIYTFIQLGVGFVFGIFVAFALQKLFVNASSVFRNNHNSEIVFCFDFKSTDVDCLAAECTCSCIATLEQDFVVFDEAQEKSLLHVFTSEKVLTYQLASVSSVEDFEDKTTAQIAERRNNATNHSNDEMV